MLRAVKRKRLTATRIHVYTIASLIYSVSQNIYTPKLFLQFFQTAKNLKQNFARLLHIHVYVKLPKCYSIISNFDKGVPYSAWLSSDFFAFY